jgi:hypothetical protein
MRTEIGKPASTSGSKAGKSSEAPAPANPLVSLKNNKLVIKQKAFNLVNHNTFLESGCLP